MVAYMAGADVVVAEGGWLNFFKSQVPGDDGTLPLSRLGEVGAHFYQLTQRHPERGIAYTPMALLIDQSHGIYPGFGKRRAWDIFPYERGDQRILDIWDIFFPGSIDVQEKRNEKGYLVSSPMGDILDVLITTASEEVIASYPVLLLAGELTEDPQLASRLAKYIQRGGLLLLCENDAKLPWLRTSLTLNLPLKPEEKTGYIRQPVGDGAVVVYSERGTGDERPLMRILKALMHELVPIDVSGNVEYLLNRTADGWIVTLVANDGITKSYKSPPQVDSKFTQEVALKYTGKGTIATATIWGHEVDQPIDPANMVILLAPGETRIVHLEIGEN